MTTFDFDQRIQLNISGKIGDKIELGTQYNTESLFDFENQMKLEYTGYEDDIIKKIEVGNNIRISTSAIADTTSRARFVIYHNPEMRSTPTVAETNLDLGGTDINAIATTGSTDLNDVIITRGSGSHSTGDILDVHQGSNTATLDFAAEL